MRVEFFLFLYGALVIVGLFLTFFWTRFAWFRLRSINGRWTWWSDRFFMLSAAIATASLGSLLINVGRIIGNLDYGLTPILQHPTAYPIGAGLVFALAGFLTMVALADLEQHPPHWRWTKLVAVATLVWLVGSIFIAPHVPLYPVANG